MSILKKVISHSFWLLIGNSIGRLSMFMTNIIAARFLSQDEFGQFSMLRNTISMIEGIVSGTLGSPMIKRVAEVNQDNYSDFNVVIKSLFIINIVISLIFSIIIFILAPYIVEMFFKNETSMIHGLYIGCMILIATTLSGLIQKIFIGIEKYQKLAIASIYTSLISFPIIVVLIYLYNLNGALFGIVTYFFIDFIFKYYQFRKLNIYEKIEIDFSKIKSEATKLLLFSYPLLGSIIISSIAFWYARVMIVESDGFAVIGIFDAAFQWLAIIMVITGATTSVVLSMFSKNVKNKKEFSKILWINLLVNLIISVFFAMIFIIFSKEIMSIYGDNYIQGYEVLIVLSITSIFYSLSSILNKVFIARGNIKSILSIITISVISMILLIKSNIFIGVIGLAYSFLIYYFTTFFIYSIVIFFNIKSESI
jgi:O-antigen/teichoic acid export membrane protein